MSHRPPDTVLSQSDHSSREFLLSQLRSMWTSGCGVALIPNTISMLKLNDNPKLKDIQLMGSNHLPKEMGERNPLSKTLKTLLAPVAHRIVRKGSGAHKESSPSLMQVFS